MTALNRRSELTLAPSPPPQSAAGFWQATVDALVANVAVLDRHGVIVAVNDGWAQFAIDNGARCATSRPGDGVGVGVGADYLGVCAAASVSEPLAAEVHRALEDILGGRRDGFRFEYPCHAAGQERWFAMRITPFVGGGEISGAVVVHHDITARRRAERSVAEHASLLDAADAAVIATDLDGVVTHWTAAAQRLYGWSAGEVIGRSLSQFGVVPGGLDGSAGGLRGAVEAGQREWRFAARHKDGSSFPVYARETVLEDPDGRPAGHVRVLIDLSDRVAIEQELRGTRDFLDTVTQTMADGLYVLDEAGRLVFINEAAERMFGWSREELIGQVMHDLTHSRREDGSPLRCEDSPITRARATGTAVRVDSDVFIRRDGTLLPVTYSAAPCELPTGGVGWVVVFNDITERKEREERLRRELEALDWVTRIRTALDEERFVLYAQPIIDLSSGETVQHELLIRMLADDGSVIAPDKFLPTAERFGLIREIDRYVIERGVRYAAAGHLVELNLSAASLGDADLSDFVHRRLLEHAVDPRRLVFEITETALLENEAAAIRFANEINALGCEVALDDFGTGYGSFHYLKRLPAQTLKIDREFVADLDGDPANRHVVDAIVRLARALGKRTIAEGVEDEATHAILRGLNVDCVQGYLFARPAPADDVFHMPSPGPRTLLP
ncbi:EAL domain-containing protein [Conexibacter sp. DBS9H8]|uniref:EAL domain-containing protein n=1 Tax=Conexibacter sp. DBS9H8 TaxID=2937801 RepID=UPI00200D85E1|nr:EAL domain-containing protein [Conexibacter sp. DBS9H8]